jgi:hypothetical protein
MCISLVIYWSKGGKTLGICTQGELQHLSGFLSEGIDLSPLGSLTYAFLMGADEVDVRALSARVVDSVLRLDSPVEPKRPVHDVRRNVALESMKVASQQIRSPHEFVGSLFHAVLAGLSLVFLLTLTAVGTGLPLLLFALALFLGLSGSFAFFWFPEQQEKRRKIWLEIQDLSSRVEEIALQDLRKRNRVP